MNKNTIYYKFLSEKKKYSINFDTTEISIGDIKREIKRRRNMEKAPEKFELLFYDENCTEIRDENYKVEPLKLLVIRRIPWYKLTSQFIEVIRDPMDIVSMRGNDFNINQRKAQTLVNYIEPLEKIQNKISRDLIQKKFLCKLCQKKDGTGDYVYEPVITMCCYETICEQCAKANMEGLKCASCGESFKGYMPNKAEAELKEKLIAILTKQSQMTAKINSEAAEVSDGQAIANPSNQNLLRPLESNNIQEAPRTSTLNLPQMIPYDQINHSSHHQPSINVSAAGNPSAPFFENARFFIIKSSNKENVELSQKHSEWATTVTNQKKLNEAFQGGNVILIFSINRSGNFQGYAIMTTFISDKVSNIWQNETSVKLGGSFGVYWLCLCEMPFNKVKNLPNPINNNEPVTKSRDTQELPKEIGLALCSLCYEQEKLDTNYKPMRANSLDNEMIARITEEIKRSRDKLFQRQNPIPKTSAPQLVPMPMQPSPFPHWNPHLLGSYYYPGMERGFYPAYPIDPAGYPVPGGGLPPGKAEKPRSRDRSRDKSRSRSKNKSKSGSKSSSTISRKTK